MTGSCLDEKVILFVGAGNMAEALVRGMLKSGECSPDAIRVTDVDRRRLDHFRRVYKVDGSHDNGAEVQKADITVLAVKPQSLNAVLEDIKESDIVSSLMISIAAGFPISALEAMLGDDIRVIRVMPNAPSLVGRGAAAFARGTRVTDDDVAAVGGVFRSSGMLVEVEEYLLDAVTALSGCGPAYVLVLIDAMLKAGQEMGLDSDIARALTSATVEGAARMFDETGRTPGDLCGVIASKGGATESALRVLDAADVKGIVVKAMLAARDRSRELSG